MNIKLAEYFSSGINSITIDNRAGPIKYWKQMCTKAVEQGFLELIIDDGCHISWVLTEKGKEAVNLYKAFLKL
jgi:hypothetical protein